MIRLRHETLPEGLSAVLRRGAGGDADILVSTALSADRQRAAVRVALRAARPADRRAVLLPVPVLVLAALARARLAPLLRLSHAPRAVAALTATVAAATAIVVVGVLPHLHGPAIAGRPQGGGLPVPALPGRGRAATPSPRSLPQPSGQPGPSVVPVAARSAAASARPTTAGPRASSPAASSPPPTPSPPGPQPSPSPSPTAGQGGGLCVDLLGIRICL